MLKFTLAFCAALMLMAAPVLAGAEPPAGDVTVPLNTTGIGAPAPAFTAMDSNGRPVSLSDYAGKTVVLEWTNYQCPYVRKMYDTGTMQALQKDAAARHIVWLTILSSAKGKQGYLDAEGANKRMAGEKAVPAAYLLDPDGTLGRLYNAQVSPHMFVIDRNGLLVYNGAIDDQPSVNHSTVKIANNYVKAALDDLEAGQPVKTATSKPYGCAVKY